MDDIVEERNHQYMFAPMTVGSQEQQMEFKIPVINDDVMDIFDGDQFADHEELDDILEVIKQLEARKQQDVLSVLPVSVPLQVETTPHQAMAAMPKEREPTRRSTRKGAGRRKVKYTEIDNSRWQQLPANVSTSPQRAGPSTVLHQVFLSTYFNQAGPSTNPVHKKTLKSTVQRKEKTPEEEELEIEDAMALSRMPGSFPNSRHQDPTPGTKNLNEPPQGVPQSLVQE